MFCNDLETISHLFFTCPVARVIWLIIAKCFGANSIPVDFEQCWLWAEKWFPFGEEFHAWGIGAVCWAVWKCRNKAVFGRKEKKN